MSNAKRSVRPREGHVAQLNDARDWAVIGTITLGSTIAVWVSVASGVLNFQ